MSTPLSGEPAGRITPAGEFVNLLEFEEMARRKLDAKTFGAVAGGDRSDFERLVFRPRMMVDTTGLDLTTTLLGERMFAPIVVGPVSQQQRFHPEGELAMVKGAGEAKAAVIISSESSVPLEKILLEAKTPVWYQVFADGDPKLSRSAARRAVEAGCKAVCITAGGASSGAAIRWSAVDQIGGGLGVPVMVKGVLTPDEAQAAVRQGVQAIILSSYGQRLARVRTTPMQALPDVAKAVGGRVPILIDGGFRRGTDILKALVLGASAVLLGRPPVWGLAVHGAAGVQAVLEMAQTELARNMAMLGASSAKALTRSMIRRVSV